MEAIKVENLSKIYRLGEIGTGTISRDMERWFKTKVLKQEDPFLKIGETNDRANKGKSDIVYSLQDINFEIQQGDAVGIIGRNGAGKSTLLKILSRVTTPTTGRINIKGRVASLLEVGTGFHPELTGRENIYLNGAILGMRKREIDRKLDEIIDFSGVERYIDTPVKRYSSGMYVRLAFAVAAHLESEILIVDEVLAVGDAEFQKKCLGKMGEVSKGEGRTVLFVSHNMNAIQSLCCKGIFLNNGINDSIYSNMQHLIDAYHGSFVARNCTNHFYGNSTEFDFDILEAKINNGSGHLCDTFDVFDEINIQILIEVKRVLKNSVLTLSVLKNDEIIVSSFDTDFDNTTLLKREPGVYNVELNMSTNIFKPGNYTVSLKTGIVNSETFNNYENCLSFEILLGDFDDFSSSFSSRRNGIVTLPLEWIKKKKQYVVYK